MHSEELAVIFGFVLPISLTFMFMAYRLIRAWIDRSGPAGKGAALAFSNQSEPAAKGGFADMSLSQLQERAERMQQRIRTLEEIIASEYKTRNEETPS
jgi:hypothetical protein